MKHLMRALLLPFAGSAVLVLACSSGSSSSSSGSPSGGSACETAPKVEKDSYCEPSTMSASATPNSCKAPRTVNACCAWVAPPTQTLSRGVGLNRYSSNDAAIQLGCLDDPGTVGTSKTITLKGHVRLFSSGNDSAGA